MDFLIFKEPLEIREGEKVFPIYPLGVVEYYKNSNLFMVTRQPSHSANYVKKIPLEMLETPKAHTLKRSYETRTSVKVTKVEKSCEINIRLKPKCLNNNGQSAGKS